jgi:hypothetical protein
MILFIVLAQKGFSQDTMFLTKERQYIVKVIEIEDQKVKYRRFDNLEGPVYFIDKNEILSIRYQNGTVDIFESSDPDKGKQVVTKENFLSFIKRPNIDVYVIASDSAALIHAKKALQFISSWNLVDDPSKSAIIIRFDFVNIGLGDKKGKAVFLDPGTQAVLFETKTVNTAMSWDVNTKRAVIEKIVKKEISKLVKN